jgi:hypothetical protein
MSNKHRLQAPSAYIILQHWAFLDAKLKVAKDVQYDKHPPSLRRTCTEGTRTKILDDLLDWARKSSGPNIYWLCGMAGTGKTTIAYSFCKRLDAEDLLGASFFCSRTIDESRDIRAVFPMIAHELASHSPNLPARLVEAVNKDPNIASGQPNDQFTCLIRDAIHPHLHKPRVIAFDAFDEFKTIEDARRLARVLINFAPNLANIKLFITSRQEPQLYDVLKVVKDTTLRLHEVEESLVKSDIQRYLVERSDDIRIEKELPQTWMTGEELQILQDRAGKLFIYASTVCSFLENSDPEECTENLKALLSNQHAPSMIIGQYDQLDSLYSQVLDAVQQDHRRKSLINNVLHVVVTALNPLSVQTIAALLMVDHGAIHAALKRLGAVITIPNDTDSDTPVLPFHASFPDFLHDSSRSGIHYIPEIKAHHYMMGLCLAVLDSAPAFKQDIPVSMISSSPLENIPRDLAYSCIYWLVHLREILASEPLGGAEDLQVMAFFDRHVLYWIECMALLGKLEDAVQLLQQIELSAHVRCSQFSHFLC